ncbi:RHS repeat-associated core domain-containing protein [Micromonospora ureilytica]|uniref:RHS repeat domain-containing protein n=1 Tax=Micromonospora ureilytica TaxID=709868 RepID=UPI002E0F2C15|nr:RHS repeat-associated core domain-containing protein [Micromonospora ureilytica]
MYEHGGLRLLSRPRRAAAIVVAASLVAGLLSGSPAVAKPKGAELAKAPATSPGQSVKGVKPLPTKFVTPPDDAKSTFKPTRTAWPKAASAEVDLPAASAAGARVAASTKTRLAGMPVWVQPVAGKTGPRSLKVKVADRKAAAEAAGVDGVLLSVDSDAGSGVARVGVDYAGFAEAFGGNYGSRLRLVRLPACALTTPTRGECRTASPLASTNDAGARSVSAEVSMAADAGARAAGGVTVLAAVATAGDEGGKGGTYAATDLKPSGSWTGGGSTGSFTYSYPVTVPPAASDLVPTVALSYDSGSVDGQTASTNAQASWVGDGWSTPRSYVEQSFASCMDDPGGSASPVKTFDRCYDGPLLTLSLNGSSTALVWDAAKKVWKPESDNGEVVTHVENANNGSGTYNTDYWRVTLRDGTSYEFGRNRLPGWTSGKTETKSVDHTPVYSPHSDGPCYNSSGFSSSVCTMAYRWNLDYVTDTHGNAMAYYYDQATNFYGRNKGASDVSYIRDSNLARIDYGFTDGGAYGTVANQVVFNTGDRCLSGTCQPLNSANKANWPDVPFDLICASGADCDDWSPSFFSTVRLTSIEAKQYNTVTSTYEKVDSYALSQSMPATGDGTSPTLWLTGLVRTGHDTSAGGSTAAITLPSVSFTGVKLPNRVDTAGGLPSFFRQRIATITTETGSVISPSYELPVPCSAPVTVDPAANTKSCYPVYWTPDGYTAPFRDWFHKYAVTRVTSTDPTGGAAALSTSYKYLGGAAWHFDENEVVKTKYRSYGQFRGYAKVQTFTGDGVNDRRTQAETAYYRGMSKNNNSIVLNLTDSAGGVHEDIDELAGKELESTQYLGEGGRVDSSTITSYWVSAATATRSRAGLSALTAQWVAPIKTYTRQAVTSSGSVTWRNTATDNSYDANTANTTFGELKNTYTYTVPIDAAYNQCTTYTYAPANTGKNLAGLVSHTETVSVACGGFTQGSPASVPGSVNTLTAPGTVNRPAQVVKAERTFYDDQTFATTFPQASAPSKGDVTLTQTAKDYTSGAYTWQTTGRSTYDSYGRVTDSYDAKGNKTTSGYTMNAAKLVTTTSTTNPAGHGGSVTLDTKRGIPLASTDANGIVTTQQYDALGRATSVWLNSRATSAAANHKFAYTVSKTGVSATTTQTLNNSNGYQTSVTIYDALLRTRQTQSITPAGGRMITDTFYNTRGGTRASYNGWWDDANLPAVSTPVSAADLGKQVPNQTLTTYDGLGRAVVVTNAKNGVTVSTTTTVYAGDRTTIVPPTGGVVSATLTDPIGRKKELQEYSARPTVTTPADTFTGMFTVTGGTATVSKYGYDEHGNQSTLTDASNNVWTSTYNLLGQVVGKVDPDAGSSSVSYDANGNLEQSTDGRGKTLSYTYDSLDRKTGKFAATVPNQSTANQRVSWVYDNSNSVAGVTNALGKLTTTTAYRGGQAYVTQQKAFNVFGSSLGQTVTIPDTEGALGGSYAFGHTYTSVLGLPLTDTYPAKGSLPSETVLHGYTGVLDLPTTLGGLAGYSQGVSYDAYGRVDQQKIGSASSHAFVTNTYDPHTARLTNQLVTRSTATPTTVDEQEYKYDLVGNITRKISKRLGATTPAETQCYGYDGLARLTEAWTGTDACVTAPTDANKSMVGNTIGAGSVYWTSWQIDLIGNRTQQTEHNLTGGTDTKTVYAYNGNGQNKPHTLTSTTKSGGATGTTSYAYDNAGNTTGRNAAQGNQTLTWDDAGKLTGVTGGTSGTNTFIYDADGNLLLQKEPGKNTLYLPGQQLTLNTATSVVTGSRYYALPGGGQASRSGSGTAYTFAIADHQGTPSLYLDSTAQNPTWRQYTPYGAPRGAAVTAPDNHGFLDKPMGPTGLTTIGARSYDPTIGKFASLDPLQDAQQPQQWNGYSYANNTPVTSSDPTGLIPADCREFDCYGYSPSKGCPSGCGSTDNKTYGRNNKLGSTKSTGRNGPPRKDPKRPISRKTSEVGRQLLWNRMLYMNQSMIDGQSQVVNPMDWHEVGAQWLAGNSSGTVSFYQIDPMTMAVRGHSHMDGVRAFVTGRLQSGYEKSLFQDDYDLPTGSDAKARMAADIIAGARGVVTGDTSANRRSAIGSFDLQGDIVAVDPDTRRAVVTYSASNVMDQKSLFRNPVADKSPGGKTGPANGPMSAIKQNFYWTEVVTY